MKRGTAIAVLCDVLIDARYQVEKDAINMAIEALQDRPQGEWIPCSERLPSKNQEVLLQCHNNMIVGYWMDGDFDGEKEWRVLSGDGWDSYCYFPNDVFEPLAWMPLPKPYREDGEAE